MSENVTTPEEEKKEEGTKPAEDGNAVAPATEGSLDAEIAEVSPYDTVDVYKCRR